VNNNNNNNNTQHNAKSKLYHYQRYQTHRDLYCRYRNMADCAQLCCSLYVNSIVTAWHINSIVTAWHINMQQAQT